MKIMYQLILLSLIILYTTVNQAQCVYNAIASSNGLVFNDTAFICAGNSLDLMLHQTNCPVISDNFNNGKLDTAIFVQNNSLLFNNPCDTAILPASGLVAWIGNGTFPREIKTKSLNLTNATTIGWDMKYGDHLSAPNCEPPDGPSEGVYLEYSVDSGVNWVQFPGVDQSPSGVFGNANYTNGSGGYWMPVPGNFSTGPYYKWNHYVSIIPTLAKTSNTMVRWTQPVFSGPASDHWGIDNIEIINCPMVTVLWSNGSQLINPPPVYPVSDTFYSVIVIDFSQNPVMIFKDTVFVVVYSSIPTSSFSVASHVCSGDTILITYTGNAPSAANFNWDFGDYCTILSGSGAGPYKVLWYNVFQDSVIHTIQLVINKQTACASPLTTQQIVIYGNTELEFEFQNNYGEGCSPLNISVLNDSYAPPNLQTKYTWHFGDGTSSDSVSPSHTYLIPGYYDFTIESNNNKGCHASWTGVDLIHVIEIPPTPNITKLEDTLYTENNLNYRYQWYVNDSLIMNANQYYCVPMQVAYYTVTIENSEGCISLPSKRALSIDKSELFAKDALIPNPSHLFFSIKFNPIVYQVDILNMNGVLLKTYANADPLNMYYIDELSNGLYFVKIYADGIVSMQKLIKY